MGGIGKKKRAKKPYIWLKGYLCRGRVLAKGQV